MQDKHRTLQEMSVENLVQAYLDAVRVGLDTAFIKLLEEEMVRRGIQIPREFD